jgi:hypothetical protein
VLRFHCPAGIEPRVPCCVRRLGFLDGAGGYREFPSLPSDGAFPRGMGEVVETACNQSNYGFVKLVTLRY